jgi:hypothetical protein
LGIGDFAKDAVAHQPVQGIAGRQIDSRSEQTFEPLLEFEESETGVVLRLEFHQHVNVAVRPRLAPRHRAEHADPRDAVAVEQRLGAAQLLEGFVEGHEQMIAQTAPAHLAERRSGSINGPP